METTNDSSANQTDDVKHSAGPKYITVSTILNFKPGVDFEAKGSMSFAKITMPTKNFAEIPQETFRKGTRDGLRHGVNREALKGFVRAKGARVNPCVESLLLRKTAKLQRGRPAEFRGTHSGSLQGCIGGKHLVQGLSPEVREHERGKGNQ